MQRTMVLSAAVFRSFDQLDARFSRLLAADEYEEEQVFYDVDIERLVFVAIQEKIHCFRFVKSQKAWTL